jgi:hypothetical protein
MKEIGCEGAEWIHVAQDIVQLQPLMNTVMNCPFHKKRNISLLAE